MFFLNHYKRKKHGNIEGKKYERKVARKLRLNGIKIIAMDKDIYDGNRRITDIDIETKYANIEVKTCEKKSGIGKQLRKYQRYSVKEPIGMAPNLNNTERKQLNKEGFNVFSREKNLIKYLKEKNKNPNMKKIIFDPKKQKKGSKNNE